MKQRTLIATFAGKMNGMAKHVATTTQAPRRIVVGVGSKNISGRPTIIDGW